MTPDDLYYEIGVLHVENKVLLNMLKAKTEEVERLTALLSAPVEPATPKADSPADE